MREIGTPYICRLAYNEFSYKNTKDNHKFEDRFQENSNFSISDMRNRRLKGRI
jgi:hypothetical protein